MQDCHNHEACATQAIADAEQACQKMDARMTPTRRRILELLWESHQPSKAYDILTRLQQEMPSAKPPTVYRALDFLLEHGLIHRIERLNAFVGCHHPQQQGQCYFFLCKECHNAQELHIPELTSTLQQHLRQHALTAHQVTLEVEGICGHCTH